MNNLIKVVNPELSEKLEALGFQYIKEGSICVFIETEDLNKALFTFKSGVDFICENKLRF